MTSACDWIHLRQFSFECVLGLLAREQGRPQRLEVELSVALDLERAAHGELASSVHYGHMLEQVQFIAQRGHWLLLESMAYAIARRLLSPPLAGERRSPIDELVLRLAKPDIFAGRAVPSVEIRRAAAWFIASEPVRVQRGVERTCLHETEESCVHQVVVADGQTFTVPAHAVALVFSGNLTVGERTLGRSQIVDAGVHVRALDAQAGLLVAAKRKLSAEDWK